MSTIQAIQTEYAGCWFRSRLEARWAVFFDTLGIRWEYEPQGYHVGSYCIKDDVCLWYNDGCDEIAHRYWYLPDFYLPDTQTWVEVKGSTDTVNWDMLASAIVWGTGLPGTEDSLGSTRGLLILGPIPRLSQFDPMPGLPVIYNSVAHPILQHRKGGRVRHVTFMRDSLVAYHLAGVSKVDIELFDAGSGDLWWTQSVVSTLDGVPGGVSDFDPLVIESRRDPGSVAGDICFHAGFCEPKVAMAYNAARSARFEGGSVKLPGISARV